MVVGGRGASDVKDEGEPARQEDSDVREAGADCSNAYFEKAPDGWECIVP